MSIPAATSLVVLGLNWSERTVTEQLGQVSVMHSAVDRPMTPAPTTATLGAAISRVQSQRRGTYLHLEITYPVSPTSLLDALVRL